MKRHVTHIQDIFIWLRKFSATLNTFYTMKNTLFTCTICKDIFRGHNELKNHVRRDHQLAVKVNFQNGHVKEVTKEADGTFKCKCKKKFNLPSSLQRHAKRCNNEWVEVEDDRSEGGLMNVDDTDASESMDLDSSLVPDDCYGPTISCENY